MNILLCCEHFYPSVGGVQKMMYELGLRFAMHGHQVTVVTSWREDRLQDSIDGIRIVSFKVLGNEASGMSGQIDEYQAFLKQGDFDFLLVMAAQQWTFDAMLPILDNIPCRKLHIPCGYSGLYMARYQDYYGAMPRYLEKFDQLIYNATEYRDIDFARRHGLRQINIIPAGASEFEFADPPSPCGRTELGIAPDDFVFLSVGAPAYSKGHREVVKAYLALDLPFRSTLVLNGNYDGAAALRLSSTHASIKETLKELARRFLGRSPVSIERLAAANRDSRKRILFTNLDRTTLISLFFEAELFVFASHVEYSPLVIYECLAAGLPFVSIPVGNVPEIAAWSNGGLICEGKVDARGFSRADPTVLASAMRELALSPKRREVLARHGRKSWEEKFTWEIIASRIEQLISPGRE